MLLVITTVRQAVGTIDYTHHDQKKDRARHRLRRRPRTESPSTPAALAGPKKGHTLAESQKGETARFGYARIRWD